MGTIVELNNDDKGILWPESVAPFQVHLIEVSQKSKVRSEAEKIYKDLQKKNIEVLYDDREDASAGQKFADADLIGIPWRVVVSEKSLAGGGVEVKKRSEKESEIIKIEKLFAKFK